MGKRGFQQRGMPNPLLQARKKPQPSQPTDKSIKNYLSRPRPTLDEVKTVVAAKESKSKRMAEFEDSQAKDFRKELDKYREKVLKADAKKRKKEEKKRKKEDKKRRKLGKDKDNKADESEDSDSSAVHKTGGSSPVQLSKFFSFAGDDLSDGEEIPLSDDEDLVATNTELTTTTTTPTTTTTTSSTTTIAPTSNENLTSAPVSAANTGEPHKKRKRWDEKPAIFQNQPFPTPTTPPSNPIQSLPQIPPQILHPVIPYLPFSTPLLTPVHPNIPLLPHLQLQQLQVQQQQLQIQQQLQVQQHLHILKMQQATQTTQATPTLALFNNLPLPPP